MKFRFLGGIDTVTGSRHLMEMDRHRVLVDCGLYQGAKMLRRRDWKGFSEPPSSIDSVILTHAHVDHTDYLPVLVKHDFRLGKSIEQGLLRELFFVSKRATGGSFVASLNSRRPQPFGAEIPLASAL